MRRCAPAHTSRSTITLHYITLHHVTLHYITLMRCTRRCARTRRAASAFEQRRTESAPAPARPSGGTHTHIAVARVHAAAAARSPSFLPRDKTSSLARRSADRALASGVGCAARSRERTPARCYCSRCYCSFASHYAPSPAVRAGACTRLRSEHAWQYTAAMRPDGRGIDYSRVGAIRVVRRVRSGEAWRDRALSCWAGWGSLFRLAARHRSRLLLYIDRSAGPAAHRHGRGGCALTRTRCDLPCRTADDASSSIACARVLAAAARAAWCRAHTRGDRSRRTASRTSGCQLTRAKSSGTTQGCSGARAGTALRRAPGEAVRRHLFVSEARTHRSTAGALDCTRFLPGERWGRCAMHIRVVRVQHPRSAEATARRGACGLCRAHPKRPRTRTDGRWKCGSRKQMAP